MYPNPPVAVAIAEGQNVSDELLDQAADHFEAFFSEVFEELAKYGEVEDMVVCDNIEETISEDVRGSPRLREATFTWAKEIKVAGAILLSKKANKETFPKHTTARTSDQRRAESNDREVE
ncbi:hypothetical protein NCLIV_050810 [Neospora caninum Liverpool]|uniref:Uncharacterized protein n=1 Tax=Neospora caninum (strain Liverpool) TaxID=572307 RepID=F0VKQ2_NEOCL|nr:hypothetical protein NCLIV_050810 [Neospora caninum Liverpool]CBZ54653.1 hypothetical protein NCLIV_050810 [Neospora caninum Liverpool]|eukprot:XP_003884683.1 hypothetical protein NCLIV_050810 [Neospora caninum Liverpool]